MCDGTVDVTIPLLSANDAGAIGTYLFVERPLADNGTPVTLLVVHMPDHHELISSISSYVVISVESWYRFWNKAQQPIRLIEFYPGFPYT